MGFSLPTVKSVGKCHSMVSSSEDKYRYGRTPSESSDNNHDNVDRLDDGEERNGQQQQKEDFRRSFFGNNPVA